MIDRPGAPCGTGPFALVRRNNAMELQQSPALNYGPAVPAALAADRVVEAAARDTRAALAELGG